MKWPTMDEFAKSVADKAIDEVEYNGKTLREWMEIIETASEDTISRRAAINVIPKKQNGTGGESWMKTYRRSGHNDCVDACVTALQGLPPVTYTKINPPSDYARQFGLIPKEDATDINVATKDSTNLAEVGTDAVSREAVKELAYSQIRSMYCGIALKEQRETMLRIADNVIGLLAPVASKQPEIVRCKDCKYWREHKYAKETKRYIPFCGFNAIYTKADDFCSRAERRTDEQTD